MKQQQEFPATPQPCLLLHHMNGKIQDCYLLLERKVLYKVEVNSAIIVLFCPFFFAFNIHYPTGCSNFYTLLKYVLLNNLF